MNFCPSDIPGASLNRRLPAYETYRPRFDATREALCIACMVGQFHLNNLNNKANESRARRHTRECGQTLRFAMHVLLIPERSEMADSSMF